MLICAIDNSEHETYESLNKVIRKYKIAQKEYYPKYHPRKDLLTGQPIPFKNCDQYFSADFLNKNNLKKYLKEHPLEGKEWALKWLKKRILDKELNKLPMQVELASLACPTIHYYDRELNYYSLSKELKLKEYLNNLPVKYRQLINPVIICDNREQKPLKFEKVKTENGTLNYGDYTLKKNNHNVYIERKSMNDFIQTFSSRTNSDKNEGIKRFRNEVERAKKDNAYIVVLVESPISEALKFNHLWQYSRFTKSTPAHVFKNIRDLLHDYDNVQFLFVNGREEAAKMVIRLFSMGELVKKIDLQYKYEKKELNVA